MPPERIVSLVPSLTELVWWFGAGERLVGRTKFCTEPPELTAQVSSIGGTKNPDLAKIRALRPDLVIANKEENRREDVEALQSDGLDVFLTDPNTISEAVAMIRSLGSSLGFGERSGDLATRIEEEIARGPRLALVSVYAGVWHNPMMGLGTNSYGHSLIEACGATNVLSDRKRYPEVTMDELRALKPDLILLPDEPFPFDEGHAAVYREVAPTRLIDGKLLWWYGPRMPEAIRTLSDLFAGAAE